MNMRQRKRLAIARLEPIVKRRAFIRPFVERLDAAINEIHRAMFASASYLGGVAHA